MFLFYHHIKKKKISVFDDSCSRIGWFVQAEFLNQGSDGGEIMLSWKVNGKLWDKIFPQSVYKYYTK